MRPVTVVGMLMAGLVAVLPGCAGAPPRQTVERVGGVERVRPFASATAYEAFLRAELAAQRGDPAAAARLLELAEVGDPGDPYLPARRAELLFLAGQKDDALAVARTATARFPESGAAWLVLGEILIDRRDANGAATAFTRALQAAPDDPEIRGAVARAQGASAMVVAHAIESAPQARPGDRTVARRMALDTLGDDRPTLRTARRERARGAWQRRAYGEVDAILTPLVMADAADVIDRVRVIEARVADGRPGDAARLIPGVAVSANGHGVNPAEHARLWLIAGRADLAAEEAERAFAAQPDDILGRVVLGEALARSTDIPRGVALLAQVPADSPRFADARIAAARGLARAARGDLADLTLARSVTLVPADDGPARDRLRLARASLLFDRGLRGEARAALASIESALGRQRRGALLAADADPATVITDLRIRSGEPGEDAIADAWIALICGLHSDVCAQGERDRALVSARAGAASSPETLRALAVAASDRREGAELLRLASVREPMSPWNAVVSRQLGLRAQGTAAPPR